MPISLAGDSPGAREAGGTVIQQLREVTVEALPLEIPSTIEVDLSKLTDPSGTIRAGELDLGANVTLVTDSDEVVARIEVLRAVEEEVEEGVSPEAGGPTAPEASEEDSSE